MEAELNLYQDLYALSNCEKKDIKDIDDYSRYVKNLQWFAEQGSRKIYDGWTHEEVENDARFKDYCNKWKSEVGLGIFATASIRTKESKTMLDFYNTLKA